MGKNLQFPILLVILLIMVLEEKQEHQELVEKTIDYLKNKGFNHIRADIDGYESPKSFKMKNRGIDVTPDIVAENNGRVQYIEVGMKSDNKRLLKTKWKFLKTLADIKNRNFKVISHKGSYGFTDGILQEINLNKKAVRI